MILFLKKKNRPKKLLKTLSSLKFAIIILLIIATFSVLGTIIEQNQTIEFYKQNYPENKPLIGFISWRIIQLLNLDNVYRSWWYLFLLIILGSSLITCTFKQQLPILNKSKNLKIYERKSQFRKLDLKLEIEKKSFENFIHTLTKETYNVFHYNKSLFCYKGIIGRIAPIIVHASIIQIFIGAIIGATLGFGGQEIIPKNETFHLQNLLNSGIFSSMPNNLTTRINNFWIDYNDTNLSGSNINQFYSDISILNSKGQELKRKIISVNNPLHYKNITIYQSDWDISFIRIIPQENKEKILQYQTKKINTNNGKRWLTNIKTNGNEFNLLLKDLDKEILIFDKNEKFIKKIREKEDLKIDGKKYFYVYEILPSTGLDIKSDPGIPFVYFGFVFLIFSTVLSFISFSKIWVFEENEKVYIGANSNRAKKSFEEYFLKNIIKAYK